jgi:hypothetical protein
MSNDTTILTWKDRPRTKDKVAFIGFAPTTRHLAPWDDDSYEIWTLNEEYKYDWVKRTDRHFQFHPRWDFMRDNNMNDRNHPLWLQNKPGMCMRCNGEGAWVVEDKGEKKTFICPDCKKGRYTPHASRNELIGLYLQETHDDIPGSIAFPLEEAKALLPASLHQRDYFTSSVALMLTLAYMMGYKRVELYGFEMGTTTEYHYQRANFEFLVGLFSRDMEIVVPKQSTLLRGDLYGYKNMKTGFRQNLEMRKIILEDQEKKQAAKVHVHTGRVQALQSVVQVNSEFKQSLEDDLRKYQEIIGLHNVIKGAQTEVENLTKLYDNYFLSGGTEEGSVLSAEEVQAHTNLAYE